MLKLFELKALPDQPLRESLCEKELSYLLGTIACQHFPSGIIGLVEWPNDLSTMRTARQIDQRTKVEPSMASQWLMSQSRTAGR